MLTGWTTEASIVATVPPGAFLPPPRVRSAVVSLTPRPVQPDGALFRTMERVTAAAFGQRRKMLRGALKGLGGETLLARAGIDGLRRAETLSIDEFARLAVLLPSDGEPTPSDTRAPDA